MKNKKIWSLGFVIFSSLPLVFISLSCEYKGKNFSEKIKKEVNEFKKNILDNPKSKHLKNDDKRKKEYLYIENEFLFYKKLFDYTSKKLPPKINIFNDRIYHKWAQSFSNSLQIFKKWKQEIENLNIENPYQNVSWFKQESKNKDIEIGKYWETLYNEIIKQNNS